MIMLNGTVFCVFSPHMFDWLFFIMIMNRLRCQGRKLKREVEQALDFSPSNSGSNSFWS